MSSSSIPTGTPGSAPSPASATDDQVAGDAASAMPSGAQSALQSAAPSAPSKAKPGFLTLVVRWFFRLLLTLILPAAVLVGAVLGAQKLIDSGPKAVRKARPRRPLLVDTQVLVQGQHRTKVHAMGNVIPSQEVPLLPRVGGQVMDINPKLAPGGIFKHKEMMLVIDRADFELVVKQRESDVAQANAEVRIEQGKQAIAAREYELLGEEIDSKDRDLVLRLPQLQMVRAKLKAAEAMLAKAKLDWDRAKVASPFNAMVRSRDVNIGSNVSANTELAMLVGTDTYWVEVSVPVDQLKWLGLNGAEPQPASNTASQTESRSNHNAESSVASGLPTNSGSSKANASESQENSPPSVRVYNDAAWGSDVYRPGRILRLTGDLERQGRMARLLIEVADPLGLNDKSGKTPRLLLDSYVRVEIDGIEIDNVVSVPRPFVRNGDQVWLMQDGKLVVRDIDIAYRDRDRVLVAKGLNVGDAIITTDLSAPVPGMLLRIGGDEDEAEKKVPANPAAGKGEGPGTGEGKSRGDGQGDKVMKNGQTPPTTGGERD